MTSRRGVLKGGVALAAAALVVRPATVAALAEPRHGFSPLGGLRYGPDFAAFAYVDPAAAKGGALRSTRAGTFDTVNTLTYPGVPPADLRLIYDRLIVQSDDEAASYYGALAQTIAVAGDYGRIVFTLRPEARWHDGTALTAEDVAFTFAKLKEAGAPYYRQSFGTLDVAIENGAAVFVNARPGDRDVLRRIATIPIHPRHLWENGTPDVPVGSGPYRLKTFDPPHRLVLARVDDWWGRDLPVNAGRWNFDTLTFDFVRDPVAALEQFKAGAADVRGETDPIRWRHGYDGPALRRGAILKGEAQSLGVGDLHGLVVNLRRPLLADRRVRLALALAYDADEANRLLFEGAYLPFGSVFGEGPLAARGAAGAAERAILGADVAPAALQDPAPLAGLPPPGSREALALASRLLDEAGAPVSGRTRRGPDGREMTLSVLATGRDYDKVVDWLGKRLALIGVTLAPVSADPATSGKMMLERDFDLATLSWAPARLPGTSERLLWHSALADASHSYALSGLKSRPVDAAIEALEQATDEAALAAAGRAFDRAFRAELALIPLWRNAAVWTAWWDRFNRPAAEKAGFPPSPLDRWWSGPA